MYISDNYFNRKWATQGHRRVKNIVVCLEWVPDAATLANKGMAKTKGLLKDQEERLKKAFALFDTDQSGTIDAVEMKSVMSAIGVEADGLNLPPSQQLDFDAIKDLLASGKLLQLDRGRFFVALSLAEAETVRRAIHLTRGQDIFGAKHPTSFALRVKHTDQFTLLDSSHGFRPASPFHTTSAQQCFRFLNSDSHYSDAHLNVLLQAIQSNPLQARKEFYQSVQTVRRRLQRHWSETPLAKIFTVPDEYHLLAHRAKCCAIRKGIHARGMLLQDAFRAFDHSRNGLLDASELYGALEWLGVKMAAAEVFEFVRVADLDKDGFLNYDEFVAALQAST
jgi:Ca2+-binding EF-hand superfamily protein